MALLARPLCRRTPHRPVGLLGMSGLRTTYWRSLTTHVSAAAAAAAAASSSASASGSGRKPTKEELIAKYPFPWPWGQTLNIKTPTGVVKVKIADAPGETQHQLFRATIPTEIATPPPGPIVLGGKSGKIAHALFNAARDAKCVDAALVGLDRFIDKYNTDRNLVAFFYLATNTVEMRNKLLQDTVAELGSPPCVADALIAMLRQRRLKKTAELRRMFSRLVTEFRKEKSGAIISAEPLSEQQYAAISAKMQKLIAPGETLVIDRQVEPDVVGGLMIRVGNKMQDLTVSHQITRMEQHLKAFFAANQKAVDKVLATA